VEGEPTVASVWSKPGSNDTTLWYATIYVNGAARQFPLKERDGSRPAARSRALALAGRLEHDLKQNKQTVNIKNRRQALFTTVWPLFVAAFVSKKAKNTQSDYEWTFKGHFQGADFARKRVSNITHTDIDTYVAKKKKTDPLSAHTLNNQLGMLSRFFQWAEQEGYWSGAVNPAKAMGLRQRLTTPQIVYLQDPDHVQLLIDSVHTGDPRTEEKYRTLTATLCWTGIRWSEARSLLWSQVMIGNPKHRHLRIKTTAVGKEIQSWTKTAAGDRYVGVCSTLARMLEQWRRSQWGGTDPQARLGLGIADPDDGLVFPSEAGTMLSPGNFRKRQFNDAKGAAHKLDPTFPLDLTVHGLRHTFNMTLERQGLSTYARACELGHKDTRHGSTKAYTHPEATRQNPAAAAAIDASIKTGKTELARKAKARAQGKPAPISTTTPPPLPKKRVARKSPGTGAAGSKGKSSSGAVSRTASRTSPKAPI